METRKQENKLDVRLVRTKFILVETWNCIELLKSCQCNLQGLCIKHGKPAAAWIKTGGFIELKEYYAKSYYSNHCFHYEITVNQPLIVYFFRIYLYMSNVWYVYNI